MHNNTKRRIKRLRKTRGGKQEEPWYLYGDVSIRQSTGGWFSRGTGEWYFTKYPLPSSHKHLNLHSSALLDLCKNNTETWCGKISTKLTGTKDQPKDIKQLMTNLFYTVMATNWENGWFTKEGNKVLQVSKKPGSILVKNRVYKNHSYENKIPVLLLNFKYKKSQNTQVNVSNYIEQLRTGELTLSDVENDSSTPIIIKHNNIIVMHIGGWSIVDDIAIGKSMSNPNKYYVVKYEKLNKSLVDPYVTEQCNKSNSKYYGIVNIKDPTFNSSTIPLDYITDTLLPKLEKENIRSNYPHHLSYYFPTLTGQLQIEGNPFDSRNALLV